MKRDAVMTELLEIEALLQDDRLNDNDRHALHGAQQALRNVLDFETWQQASQTFYRIDNRPSAAVSLLLVRRFASPGARPVRFHGVECPRPRAFQCVGSGTGSPIIPTFCDVGSSLSQVAPRP
jgi:hypothetical protein